MKKISLFLLIIIMMFVCVNSTVSAKSEVKSEPYDTFIIGLDGQLITSPLAYEGVYVLNLDFINPQDLFIYEKNNDTFVYIADSEAKVVYCYNVQTKEYTKIGSDVLEGPQGVTVDNDGNIYVADPKLKSVIKFDNNGQIIKRFDKPQEYLYGEESDYRPTKVAVDKNKDIYITSQNNANGVIQLNSDGEFVGYFGPNNINVTLQLLIKRLMLPKEDRETYASLNPKASTNLTIDEKGIVYTIINGEPNISLKKFNVNGNNILAKSSYYSNSYQDICVDNNGLIYTVDNSKSNVVQVMDSEGNLLFGFGNTKSGSMSLGQFDQAMGIDVDKSGNIWVLDSTGKNIQVFMKTQFASTAINALLAYNAGEYDIASMYYKELIAQNSSFVQAYIGLGQIAQREQNYSLAKEYFEIANYKSGYSEVFWELRDEWLNNNLLWMFIVVMLLIIINLVNKRYHLLKYLPINTQSIKEKLKENKVLNELKYLLLILKKPFYVFYDIKVLLKIRFRTALVLFVFFIMINIFGDYFILGYLYRVDGFANMNFALEILRWGLIIILFVIGNYLISTLQSGEGFFRDIFIGTIFSLAPIIVFRIPLDLLTNVLTYNEEYIYNILNTVMWAWSIFNIILMLKEIHNFKLKELIVNILLTIVAMIVLILLYLMIYILSMQLIQFVFGLIEEGVSRI